MGQYLSVTEQNNYETSLAMWDSIAKGQQSKIQDQEPQPPVPYDERLVTEPETIDSLYGQVVADAGDHILQSNRVPGHVFVVHANDLNNPNLWVEV